MPDLSHVPKVDFKRIPDKEHGDYRVWLVWTLRNLHADETLKLPIFSAISVRRYKDGFTLTQRGKTFGFTELADLLAFMEYDIYKPNAVATRLANIAKVNVLYQQKGSLGAVMKETGLSLQIVNRYVEPAADMAVSGI
jgi:hypothetical protein